MPVTSVPLIFLPTTSRSRSRLTTSTSGSSGILSPHHLQLAVRVRAQPEPRSASRGLLGLLLGSTFAEPSGLATDQHRREEALGMVGSLVPDLIPRQLLEALRGELLEAGLVVVPARTAGRIDDSLAEQSEYDVAGGVGTAVEVDRGDHRFHRVGEDRSLGAPARGVLSLAELQARAQLDLTRKLGQHFGIDHRSTHLRELTLLEAGVGVEHVIRHDNAEHRVAEELEPLVGMVFGMLRAPRPMGQRLREQVRVDEGPTEQIFEAVSI